MYQIWKTGPSRNLLSITKLLGQMIRCVEVINKEVYMKATCSEKIFIHFYIPINVFSLDTVDFIECNTMLRITTLWFSESISPLSEIDDVVHNVFLNTQCIRYCDVINIAPYIILNLFQNGT